NGVWRALRVGQVRGARADGNEGAFLFRRDGRHGQVGGGVGAADQHIQAFLVEPFACAAGGDVRFVLVIRGDQLDFFTVDFAAGIGNRHADRLDACRAVDIG